MQISVVLNSEVQCVVTVLSAVRHAVLVQHDVMQSRVLLQRATACVASRVMYSVSRAHCDLIFNYLFDNLFLSICV